MCLKSILLSCRIRKVWQKRKCGVKFGCLTISHSTVRTNCWHCPPKTIHKIKVNLSIEFCQNTILTWVYMFVYRSIDHRPNWTSWPVRCGQTQRTGGPLTWSLVGSFLTFDLYTLPSTYHDLRLMKSHLQCSCVETCLFGAHINRNWDQTHFTLRWMPKIPYDSL